MGDKITTGEKWEQNFGSRKPENETGKKQINLHHRTPPSPPLPQMMRISSLKGDTEF